MVAIWYGRYTINADADLHTCCRSFRSTGCFEPTSRAVYDRHSYEAEKGRCSASAGGLDWEHRQPRGQRHSHAALIGDLPSANPGLAPDLPRFRAPAGLRSFSSTSLAPRGEIRARPCLASNSMRRPLCSGISRPPSDRRRGCEARYGRRARWSLGLGASADREIHRSLGEINRREQTSAGPDRCRLAPSVVRRHIPRRTP